MARALDEIETLMQDDWEDYKTNKLSKFPLAQTDVAKAIAEMAFFAGWANGIQRSREFI
jgi:hypothetical protein